MMIKRAYCRHCFVEKEVKPTRCGYTTLLKCVDCGFWIRCDDCFAIRSVNHVCEVSA
jgi:hypothetical protein